MHSWAPGSFLWWYFGISCSYLKFNFQILSRFLTHSKKCWPGIRCLLQKLFGHLVLCSLHLWSASCWMHGPSHLNMVAIIEELIYRNLFPCLLSEMKQWAMCLLLQASRRFTKSNQRKRKGDGLKAIRFKKPLKGFWWWMQLNFVVFLQLFREIIEILRAAKSKLSL